MNLKILRDKVLRVLSITYKKLVKINDTPQRVAIGMGLGAFVGMMPFAGPVAAIFFATIFRINRASAFLGSLFTNTWLSFVTFIFAVKLGSAIMGLDWHYVDSQIHMIIKNFHWKDASALILNKIMLAMALGYIIISLVLGLCVYILSLAFIKMRLAAKHAE